MSPLKNLFPSLIGIKQSKGPFKAILMQMLLSQIGLKRTKTEKSLFLIEVESNAKIGHN